MSENVMQDGANYYGDYKAMTGGIERSTYTHYGISAGLRIFFGEKSDIDGDGLIDIKDRCMYVYGSAQKNGCPDRDGDGVIDDDDACPDEFGSEYTNGCPDRDADGFADKVDECPDEPGEYKGCTAEFISSKRKPETNLVDQTGAIMAPHVVLETDIINYDYNKTAIPDSSLPVLENTVKILQKNPKVVIHISGYTDDIGSYTSNIILSYERAKNIKAFMVKNGIPENRVILSAYGMEHPVTENNSDSNRAKNRRIEFKLLLPIE
jgi:outer membrane protein OmpA-like peptidoglycan-associated protein